MTLLDGEYYTYTLDLGVQSTLQYLVNKLWNPESALQKERAASPTFLASAEVLTFKSMY